MYKVEYKKITYPDLSPRAKREYEHLLCYELLYKMLEEHFGIKDAEILLTDNGKPYVDIEDVHFSLTHTEGLIACVVSDSLVGIDAEKALDNREENHQRLAKRFFTPKEVAFLEMSGNDKFAFYKVWCGKEACIKQQGGTMALLKKIDTTEEKLEYIFDDDYIICIKI